MSNMIISIIAIALAGVLALSTLIWVGSSFVVADEGVKATEIINHAQQIAAATEAFIIVTEGQRATDIEQLVGPGLSQIPKPSSGGSYSINGTQVLLGDVTEGVCLEIANRATSYFNCSGGEFFYTYRVIN